jgi:hypothetical protein
MRHTVKLHGVVVGHSELEDHVPGSREAAGVFRPGLGYELVQPVFALFSEAVPLPGGEPMDAEKLERYHAARDRLGLSLVDAAGHTVPTNVIHIADYGEDDLRLEVLLKRAT